MHLFKYLINTYVIYMNEPFVALMIFAPFLKHKNKFSNCMFT
jgi:hypothetical protein